jgi:hypothetical protein
MWTGFEDDGPPSDQCLIASEQVEVKIVRKNAACFLVK